MKKLLVLLLGLLMIAMPALVKILGLPAVLGGACVLLYNLADAPVTLLGCGVLVLILLFDFWAYHRSMTRGVENVLHVGTE